MTTLETTASAWKPEHNFEASYESIFRERANGKWEHFTYLDGARIYITPEQAGLMLAQGARIVVVQ